MENNLPQNNLVPVTPEVQPIVPVKTNNFLVVLLSILLFLAVSIAGFFAYQTQKLVKELRVMSDELKQTTDPIADWKIYTNQFLEIYVSRNLSRKQLSNQILSTFKFID